ncbi:MAG: hypothetical protein KBC33_03935 [Candidatus Pacebacteria bacterium]|nr:hypothetical protein [Candidatus Paceibacterota bacterium]
MKIFLMAVCFFMAWFSVGITLSAFGVSNPVSVIIGFVVGVVAAAIMNPDKSNRAQG